MTADSTTTVMPPQEEELKEVPTDGDSSSDPSSVDIEKNTTTQNGK